MTTFSHVEHFLLSRCSMEQPGVVICNPARGLLQSKLAGRNIIRLFGILLPASDVFPSDGNLCRGSLILTESQTCCSKLQKIPAHKRTLWATTQVEYLPRNELIPKVQRSREHACVWLDGTVLWWQTSMQSQYSDICLTDRSICEH